jgi:hypothetical protein
LDRRLAYRGRIGRRREDFCLCYIKRKRNIIREIERIQPEKAARQGGSITCHKGCSFCCWRYVEASVQECEAIVYYLYRNEDILLAFLNNYPGWYDKIRENGDLFNMDYHGWQEASILTSGEGFNQAIQDMDEGYRMQEVMCPFLVNSICAKHDVRPYVCASFSVTTPAERCRIFSPRPVEVCRVKPPERELNDLSFYYIPLDTPLVFFMPPVVYGILKGGYRYLSTMPGLEALEYESDS